VGVTFINTDGMAFIGPGSEWFWTALSGIVLAVTFVAIYRQLSLQRSTNAREQLDSMDREFRSERLVRCKLEVLIALRDGTDPAEVPLAPAHAIALFWERIAALAQGGHLDPTLLHQFNGGACPVWWVALAPFVGKVRVINENPTEYRGFQRLADEMSKLDLRAGAGVFDATLLATTLNERIATYQDALRLEQALRQPADTVPGAGTVRPMSPPLPDLAPRQAAEPAAT
jgi:hypothetical protein